MAKKIATVATAAVLALTLCLGLAGCGPDKGNFTGTWRASTLDGTPVDQLNSWAGSVDMTITLNEDGTATIKTSSTSILGGSSESEEATWVAKSGTECTITDSDGGEAAGKLDGEVLTVEAAGTVATFKRA
ncbi:hypothetical protein FIC87_11245 [Eggerthella lenta]|uniref:Lipocalin-like domain-containing protein n=1 Tax=Eggerthella lenta TaxID=84112 RepID=A0A5C5BS73_EGGLN|nr:hypothetical protein [Eggerthella lenta]TNU89461.1 hypothetical protein FIC87_11245 [Eggerthella lenta]